MMRKNGVPDFIRQIDRDGPNGCWLWSGALLQSGYGNFNYGGKKWRAHRFSYSVLVGPIGDAHVLHRCDNPQCVNPEHLFLGTPADNAADKAAKGRTGREKRIGEGNGLAKLTEENVRMIRRSNLSGEQLAKQLGVSKVAVNYARSGQTWSHVT